MNQENCVLEVSGLSVDLGGRQVLAVPSLQVLPKEVLVIIGPNGAGKTTLLLCLASLLKPSAGVISYQGRPVSDSDILRLRRQFAVVFQEPLLLNGTVWDNVTLGLRLRGVEKEEIKDRAQRWLERFGVAPLASRQAKTLSAGEAKRVSLARAFALQPEILFLDEPFTALDSPTHQSLIGDFENVLRETKVTTVMVTHDRDEALMLANRVVVLMDGEVTQTGSPREVFNSPASKAVADFVGVENILDGVVKSSGEGVTAVEVNGRIIEAISGFSAGEKVSVCIRPENVTLALTRGNKNSFSARVARLAPRGTLIHVELNCGFPLLALVTRNETEALRLEPGCEVYVTFKPGVVHIIKC